MEMGSLRSMSVLFAWLCIAVVAVAIAADAPDAPNASEPKEEPSALPPLYSADDFRSLLPTNNHFIKFFAPWCGHCQRLEPVWAQLAELLNEEGSRVTIARVDCTIEKDICSENDITGYPTLKFYKIGDTEGVRFRGIRDLPTLSSFINEQLGDSSPEDHLTVPIEPAKCIELTDETFSSHVANGYHFVKFYAPWCGYCQKLAPAWEKLADTFSENEAVSISKVDCTQYRTVCNQFDVKGYPTLLWIEDGKKIEKYTGQRTHEELKTFVDSMITDSESSESEESDSEISDGHAVMTLTAQTFDHGIQNEYVFVEFYAPWCGHCKRLAPTWEELGRKFINHDRVKIAKVDCSAKINKDLCSAENVDGFPSLFLFKNGKKLSEYEGSRSLDDLFEFVAEQLSTARDEL